MYIVLLVMCNAWKTPEEQNRHWTAFLVRIEIEVDHGKIGYIWADIDLMDMKMSVSRQWKWKIGKYTFSYAITE